MNFFFANDFTSERQHSRTLMRDEKIPFPVRVSSRHIFSKGGNFPDERGHTKNDIFPPEISIPSSPPFNFKFTILRVTSHTCASCHEMSTYICRYV